MQLFNKVKSLFSRPKERPFVPDFGMNSWEGNKAVQSLLEEVYGVQIEDMLDPDSYYDAVEVLRKGLSLISLEHPEISEQAVRDGIFMVIGEEFATALM